MLGVIFAFVMMMMMMMLMKMVTTKPMMTTMMTTTTMMTMMMIMTTTMVMLVSPVDGSPDQWDLIPDDIESLCPNTDICYPKQDNNVLTEEKPCCRGCSCDDDCSLTNNCCFPDMEARLTEINKMDMCQYSITKYTDKIKTRPIQSFYMVDRCPGQPECETCGRQKVAEWGSLYPVFSKTTGLIYKNPICADCFNVTDGQIWEPHMVTDMDGQKLVVVNRNPNLVLTNDESDPEKNGHMIVSKLMDSKNMIVQFLEPQNEPAIDAQVCYKNLVDSCVHDYAYRIFGNVTDHELCATGLRAPIWYNGDYYGNVFCLQCILDGFRRKLICTPDTSQIEASFVASLDKNITLRGEVSENPVACTPDGKDCKEVLCPPGHRRYNNNNTCVLIQTKWKRGRVHTILEFHTASDDGRLITRDTRLSVSVSLPRDTSWELRSIIAEVDDTDSISRVYAQLVLDEVKKDEHLIPREVLQSVQRLVRESTCSITVGDDVSTFKAHFSKYAYLLRSGTSYKPLWLAVKDRRNVADEVGSYNKLTTMTAIYQTSKLYPDQIPISISKLFFCPQVELKETEFVSFYDGNQLLHKKTGQYFMDGEFTVYGQVARICLEDSGYYLPENHAHFTCLDVLSVVMSVMGYIIQRGLFN